MKDLEAKLMSEFSEGFPWPAFEAAAQKLKVDSSVMLKLLGICRQIADLKFFCCRLFSYCMPSCNTCN